MKIKSIFQRYGAVFVAVVVFLIAAYIYCYPVLQGKVLSGNDFEKMIGAMGESIMKASGSGDGTASLWNTSMFSGMPKYQIGGKLWASMTYLEWLKGIFASNGDWGWAIFFYFISFYILMRAFGVGKWLSIAGAFALGLSSYFIVIIPAGHITKTLAIPMIAVVFAGFKFIFSKRYILGAALTMLFVALSFLLHPQIFYYYFMLIGVVWVAEFVQHIKEKKMKELAVATLIFVGSAGLGIGCQSAYLLANNEYIPETIRGGSSEIVHETNDSVQVSDKYEGDNQVADLRYATNWSYGIGETMSLIIPGFRGLSSHYHLGDDSFLYKTLISNGISGGKARSSCEEVPMYWGDQVSTLGNVYVGAVVCLLFLLGLLIVKGTVKWALLAATLFSILLAWGSNFMWLTELFFNYFPMYSKFRSVSSILIVAEIAMPLLGFLALKEIIDGNVPKKKLMKSLAISFGATAGICLFFALFGNSIYSFKCIGDSELEKIYPVWYLNAIVEQRSRIFRLDSLRSFLFIGATALMILLFEKEKLRKSWFVALICVIVIVDLWPVDRRIFSESNFVEKQTAFSSFMMLPYEKQLRDEYQVDPSFRVLNLATDTYNDSRTSFYLKSIGGYSAVKLRRYQDLIAEHLIKMNIPVIDMLNTKYFILPSKGGSEILVPNPDRPFGPAWWVDSVVCVKTATEESDALNELNLKTTAVMDESFRGMVNNLNPGRDTLATIKLTEYLSNSISYETHSSKDGIVVFSEIYYPHGWKATIDGEKSDIFRVNYVLRAMNVPAGDHTIKMVFDPDSVRIGNILSKICIFLMYVFIIAAIVWFFVSMVLRYRREHGNGGRAER